MKLLIEINEAKNGYTLAYNDPISKATVTEVFSSFPWAKKRILEIIADYESRKIKKAATVRIERAG